MLLISQEVQKPVDSSAPGVKGHGEIGGLFGVGRIAGFVR